LYYQLNTPAMKASPRRHLDIQYVSLSCLPAEQARLLRDWVPESQVFQIETGDRMIGGCIEYDDYEFWYDHERQEAARFHSLL
jgi:hypothetical protein